VTARRPSTGPTRSPESSTSSSSRTNRRISST
jgi:hypothetical protein